MRCPLLPLVLMAFLLGACASTPPPQQSGPTPEAVSAGAVASGQVNWGGRIVAVRNLAQRTLIEVLGLPLDARGRPSPQGGPQGRFIVEHPGFLEPHEYAPDRMLVVSGRLAGFTEGKVGEAPYRFPVVIAEQLELLPAQPPAGSGRASPRINFGIGGGSYGGSVGIGIGF